MTETYTPWPFQVKDIERIARETFERGYTLPSVDGHGTNWSEMGTGKTTTLLWASEELMELAEIAKPKVLIISSKTGKTPYMTDTPRTLPDWAVMNVESTGTEWLVGDKSWDKRIVLAHFDVFSGKTPKPIAQSILKTTWDFACIDEAHRIKNPKTQWTKNIKKLRAKYRHVMTGTGFVNRPDEIWSLLNFLDKKRFPSYWEFRKLWCKEWKDPDGFKHVYGIKDRHLADFKKMVNDLGPRRTKAEVFPDMPKRLEPDPIMVALTPTQRKMYDSLKADMSMLDAAGYAIDSPNALSVQTRMRQVSDATPEVTFEVDAETGREYIAGVRLTEPSAKLDALMTKLDELEWDRERKDQTVVFSLFKDTLALLAKRLDKAGITYIWMVQSDTPKVREKKIAAFQAGEAQVFLSTLALGGESITLTAASSLHMLDQSWSPAVNEQAKARIHRPGQTKTAVIYRYFSCGTIDGYVNSKNVRKQGWFSSVFGEDKGVIRGGKAA